MISLIDAAFKLEAYKKQINQGNQQLSVDIQEALKYYAKAMDLTEDKYEVYSLQAKAHMIDKDKPNAINAAINALNCTDNKVNRLQEVASYFTQLNLDLIACYVNGLIKQIYPEYDQKTTQTYDDYYHLTNQFVECGHIKYSQANIFEKLIGLSEFKTDTLIHCGQLALNGINQELAEQYFQRALQLSDEKQDDLMKIGEIYITNNLEIAEEYFERAVFLNRKKLEPHLKMVQVKLEQGLFQNALDYVNYEQIHEESQACIEIGMLFRKKPQTNVQSNIFLLKSIWLCKDQLQTLVQIVQQNEIIDHELMKVAQQRIENKTQDLKILDISSSFGFSDNIQPELADILRKVVLLEPDQGYYLTQSAQALIAQGRRDEAIQELVKGIEKCPHFSPAQYLGELLLEDNKVQESLKYFKIVIENDLPTSFRETIKFLHDRKLFDQCIEICDEYCHHNPYEGHFYKASSLFKLAKIEQALEEVNKGVEFCEGRQIQWLGDLLLKYRYLDQGLALFRRDIQSYQGDLSIRYENIINILSFNNYLQESLDFCEEFIKFDNKKSDLPSILKAQSLIALKRYNEAIPIIQELTLSENVLTVMDAVSMIEKIQELETQDKVKINQQQKLE